MDSETRRGFAFNHGDWVVTSRRLRARPVVLRAAKRARDVHRPARLIG